MRKVRTVFLPTLPKCDACGEDVASHDVPTVLGPWAFLCKSCCGRLAKPGWAKLGGKKLARRTPAQPQKGKARLAREASSTLDLLAGEDRYVKCPECGDERLVELDAGYEFDCECCGSALRCAALI